MTSTKEKYNEWAKQINHNINQINYILLVIEKCKSLQDEGKLTVINQQTTKQLNTMRIELTSTKASLLDQQIDLKKTFDQYNIYMTFVDNYSSKQSLQPIIQQLDSFILSMKHQSTHASITTTPLEFINQTKNKIDICSEKIKEQYEHIDQLKTMFATNQEIIKTIGQAFKASTQGFDILKTLSSEGNPMTNALESSSAHYHNTNKNQDNDSHQPRKPGH